MAENEGTVAHRARTRTLDYDQMAADYARHRRAHPGVLAHLADALTGNERPRVLEVGCGTGNYLAVLAEITAGGACGIDPSREMLAKAGGRGGNLRLVGGYGERLPFPPEAFDLVYSVDVIHHIRDRAAYFREALRVLNPGGRFCTVTDSAEDIAYRRPLSNYFPATVPVELARYPAIPQLRAELAEAGFVQISEERTSIAYDLADIDPYRQRSFSSLHLIDADVFQTGIAHMERDLENGPIAAVSLYTLVWAVKPSPNR